MAVISRITTQKKSKERYNIFLQDNHKEVFGFSVDESVLIDYHLHKGKELDKTTIEDLMEKDTMQKAYNMVIHYLSYRMRTEKEIVDYLKKKEIPEIHIASIMEKLIQNKLIDDHEFAESFVRTRMNTSEKGPVIIEKELLNKGVSKSIADEAIQTYTYAEQRHNAEKLIAKKSNQRGTDSHRQKINRLQNHLLQKGFTQDVIQDIISSYVFEKDDEMEWQALVHHGKKQLRKLHRRYDGKQLENKMKESLYRKGFPFPLIQSFLDEYVSLEDDDLF